MSAQPWARTIRVERDVPEPTVFVGCTGCAAEGRGDRGVWMPASEAGDAITDEVHRGRVVRLEPGVDLHVDSLAVLEVRGFPVTTPMSIERAVQWGETYEEVGKSRWLAFCAWIESGAYVKDGDGVPSVPAFWERYAGENISRSFVVPTVATCIDVVVHCERDRDGRRRVREILTVGARVEDGVIETSTLFQRDSAGDLRLNEAASLEFDAFARRGVDVHELVGLR